MKNGFDRREEDVLAYNQAALDVIRNFDIAVNDLHRTVVVEVTERLLVDEVYTSTTEAAACWPKPWSEPWVLSFR